MLDNKNQVDYGLKYQELLEKVKAKWATEKLRHQEEQRIRKSFFYNPLHPPISEKIIDLERRLDDLKSKYTD